MRHHHVYNKPTINPTYSMHVKYIHSVYSYLSPYSNTLIHVITKVITLTSHRIIVYIMLYHNSLTISGTPSCKTHLHSTLQHKHCMYCKFSNPNIRTEPCKAA